VPCVALLADHCRGCSEVEAVAPGCSWIGLGVGRRALRHPVLAAIGLGLVRMRAAGKRHPWPCLSAPSCGSAFRLGAMNCHPAAQHRGIATFHRSWNAPLLRLGAKPAPVRNDRGQNCRQRGALSLRIRSSSSFLSFGAHILRPVVFPGFDSRFGAFGLFRMPLGDLVRSAALAAFVPWATRASLAQRNNAKYQKL